MYNKTIWEDRVVDPVTGDVIQAGTKFTASRANNFEQGITNAHMLVESLAQSIIGSSVVIGLTFTSSGLTASWTAGAAYVNGVRFEVQSGSIALNPTQGQYIYLDSDGVVKKTAMQATAQAKCLLWYFATDASGEITSSDSRSSTSALKTTAASVSILDAGNKFAATDVEGALTELVVKDSTVASDAKAYTDQQVALITASGIPKLVSYPYVLSATSVGQTDFNIPLSTFVPETDTVIVVQNRTTLNKNDYSVVNVSGTYKLRLTDGVTTGTEIAILILKNVPQGPDGSVHGKVISDGTISLSKLGTDVATQQELNDHIGAADPHPIYSLKSGFINKLKVQKSIKDANGKYTTVEYRRKADNTLYLKSVLSGPDANGNYITDTWTVYGLDGATVLETIVWTITYDVDGDVTSVA